MSASITEYVDVSVVLTGAAAEKTAFGTLLGAFAHTVTTNRVDGPYFSLEEAEGAGFTVGAAANVHAWISAVFSQDDGVDSVKIGNQLAADAGDWTVTIPAIIAADPDFYMLNAETRVDTEIISIAALIEPTGAGNNPKIYMAQSSDADILTGAGGNIGEDLQTAGYNRTALWYHEHNDEAAGPAPADGYLDGAASSSGGGLNLDAPAGVGTWAFRQLDGIVFDDVTGAEAVAIFGTDTNLFGRNKGLSFTSKGTMASGRFIDVQTSLDWLKARLEEELISEFVGAGTKIPFTNAGINRMAAAIQRVYDRGVTFGHLSPDEPATLTAPDITEVSAADKAARLLTLTGNAVLAGAIHKVIFNINVQQ